MRHWTSQVIFFLLGILGFLALFPIQSRLNRLKIYPRGEIEYLYMPSGRILKQLSFGHEGLLANIYWMRAVQYYGDKRLRNEKEFPLLYSLINIAVTLDPKMMESYQFGAIFLSEPSPIGAAAPRQAVEIVQKGIEFNPDNWQLYKNLGFVYYWYLKDYRSSAQAFMKGSQIPHAAPWMKSMAALLMEQGGNRQASKFLWEQIYETSSTVSMRENARKNLAKLQADEDIELLEKIINKWESQTGNKIQSLRDLVAFKVFKEVPRDPYGYFYQYDPASGKVSLDPQSPAYSAP
jgi:tetratricopeptide (TPR) repeat protein